MDAGERSHSSGDDSREAIGSTDDNERHEPEPWTAVGDEEQHSDNDDRGQEQGEVCAFKDGRDVDSESFGTAQQCGEPVGQICICFCTDGIGTFCLLPCFRELV